MIADAFDRDRHVGYEMPVNAGVRIAIEQMPPPVGEFGANAVASGRPTRGRERRMLRTAAAVAAAVALFAVTAGSAFGTSCSVIGKPIGSGEAGTATFNVVTETFTITSLNLTPSGNLRGNFLTVSIIGPGGVVLDTVSVFGKKDLPDGAHASGPGGTSCDGVGIDDLAECGS